MQEFDHELLKQLYRPSPSSHKGQNGKLLLIGGSHLFHAASLWSLQIASKLCDMVFYASVPENNKIVQEAKNEFRNGMVIERKDIEDYVEEADVILIGPGMVRAESKISDFKFQISNLNDVQQIADEGEQTYALTRYLLNKYPDKKWVIDGGALQMIDKEWLRGMRDVILTPHLQEFERVFGVSPSVENVEKMAEEYGCVILRKSEVDVVCAPSKATQGEASCMEISGGNAGMTKGGTGDVLAGFVAAIYTKNDAYLSAVCGSFLNKKAGEYLYNKQGYAFNSSDLVEMIPVVMKELVWK